MIRKLACVLCVLGSVLQAQQLDAEANAIKFSEDFARSLDAGTEIDCRSRLESRKTLYKSANAGVLEPLRLVVEGHRLICERLRIESEVSRLRTEKSRLLSEVDRLNALWHSSGAKEFPGRDRSQQIILADVQGIEKVEQRLSIVATDLRDEASRILRLSVNDIGRHSSEEKEVMKLAIDAEAQRSIFDGFRDLLPKLS